MIKNFRKLFLPAIAVIAGHFADVQACTSAIISAELNPAGRPILWKHRDTSATDNKVEYVAPTDSTLGYVALFNADDRQLREAWMGMNEAGFAVMNTASYNLKDDKVKQKDMDKEGLVMTEALKRCRTVGDFAHLLDSLPRPMGVEANFGVIDAYGDGAFFETNNHSYIRFNLSDTKDGMLVRTNYSHAGRPNEGYGFVREANAECLLDPYAERKEVTPELLTETLSRTFYHDGKKEDFTLSENKALYDQDFIPRYKSTATIAIEGCQPIPKDSVADPGIMKEQFIMWTGLGYPPVSRIRAVRCSEEGVDPDLRGSLPNGHSRLGDEAVRKRDEIFKLKGKKPFIDMTRLYNNSGSGYAQQAIKENHLTYQRESEKRDELLHAAASEQ